MSLGVAGVMGTPSEFNQLPVGSASRSPRSSARSWPRCGTAAPLLREPNIGQQRIEHAIEVQDFLRDKFTNE
jgi:hypothetical protein